MRRRDRRGGRGAQAGPGRAGLAALILLLAGCGAHAGGPPDGGSDGGSGDGGAAPPPVPPAHTVAAVDAAAVAEPYLPGSTVMHYCDCAAGHPVKPAAGCVAGDDTTGDGSAAHPFRTLAAAGTWLNAQKSGNATVALCQGGVFDAPAQQWAVHAGSAVDCPRGHICSEIREYPAPWGGKGVKPTVYGWDHSPAYLFLMGSGVRVMNLALVGQGTGDGSTQVAFFIFDYQAKGPHTGPHDITLWNVDMTGFDLAVQDATAVGDDLTVKGCHFYESTTFGFLGASWGLVLEANDFHDNGSDNEFDHSIYLASDVPVEGVTVTGNYMDGYSATTGATGCLGGPFVMHGEFQDVVVAGNTIVEDPATAAPGCWGLSANNGGYKVGAFIRNARFSGNIVASGGNQGMGIDNCPQCLLENNVIIQDGPNGGTGIRVASFGKARTLGQGGIPATCTTTAGNTCADDPSTGYTIRNNTVVFTAHADTGMTGIAVGVEGTGFRIYDNTVSYLASAHGLQQVACFDDGLPLSSYDLVDDNNCYSADPAVVWEKHTGDTYAAWVKATAAAGHPFDAGNPAAVATGDPGLVLSGYPYLTWSDDAFAYAGFDDGKHNVLSPSGPPLLAHGRKGAATDITGAARPDPPAIGAYQ